MFRAKNTRHFECNSWLSIILVFAGTHASDREAAVEFSQHILLCMTSLELIANECSLQRRLRGVRRSLNGLGTHVTGCALSAVRRHGGH